MVMSLLSCEKQLITGLKKPNHYKVAQMSARGSKEDFKKLVAYANDKNPVIAFWGIKSMFGYENELKSAGLLNEIKKNLSHPELYIQNLTANLLLSLGEDIDCKEIILRGLNSENDFNRLEAVMLYQRLKRNKDIDTFIQLKYANQFDNGDNYEQRVLKEIYGGTFN